MSASLRVLMVSHETTLSGAPIQLLHLARWLARHDWLVTVVAPEDGPIGKALRESAIRFEAEPELLREADHATVRRYVQAAEVVVANTITTWQAIRAAELEKIPVVWYLHETLVGQRLIREIPQIRAALPVATRLVTPTRATAFVYEGFVQAEVDVVPYGIPAAELNGGDETVASRPLLFVTLGTYEFRKGQDVLLDAIASLGVPAGTASFQLAGRNLDEAFHAKLRLCAATLPTVDVLGPSDHAAATQLLAGADVLVLPSRDETMPIVLLEAMALGKAIITTDVGGIREWMRDGLNALVVPPEDAAALGNAMRRCIDDPCLVRRLGEAGKRTFQRYFSIERYGSAFEQLLRETAERKQPVASAAPRDWPEMYDAWVSAYDDFPPSSRLELRRRMRMLQERPLLSVIMPVYNPPLEVLRDAIDSVRAQVYEHWELCLADDASTDANVRPFLESAARADARIKLTFRNRNGRIAACSNSALALATGAWCALLDQDDAMAPNALAEVAAEINRHPNAGLIYSDEDKIDLAGNRSFPFFKPDWNPELFLGQNYINHLGVYRRDLLQAIGGFREGFEGSQDYDLVLRCVERLKPEQIRHLPLVLYHWRAVSGSLAAEVDAKPYAKLAARRAIQEHLERTGTRGRVEACPENLQSHRVIYELPTPAPLVSIVIATRNQMNFLRRCIGSIRGQTRYEHYELVIVDHDSDETDARQYLDSIATTANVRIIRQSGPFNFSRLNNAGAAAARGTLLAFVNNDVEAIEPRWLTEMVSQVSQPHVGAVGARLWYPDGTLQHGGVILGLGGAAGHAHHRVPRGHPGYFNRVLLQQNCSAVTAACMLVRREVFDQVCGFDELAFGVNFNDVDFCLRITARGWRIVWTPYANLLHHESVSRGTQPSAAQQKVFLDEMSLLQTRWGGALLNDPFYSPNLRLQLPAFYPAFPPRPRANA